MPRKLKRKSLYVDGGPYDPINIKSKKVPPLVPYIENLLNPYYPPNYFMKDIVREDPYFKGYRDRNFFPDPRTQSYRNIKDYARKKRDLNFNTLLQETRNPPNYQKEFGKRPIYTPDKLGIDYNNDFSLQSKNPTFEYNVEEAGSIPQYLDYTRMLNLQYPQTKRLQQDSNVNFLNLASKQPTIPYNAEEAANIPHNLLFAGNINLPYPQPNTQGTESLSGLPQQGAVARETSPNETQEQYRNRTNLENSVRFNPNDYQDDFSNLVIPTETPTNTNQLQNEISQKNNTAGIDFNKTPLELESSRVVNKTTYNPYQGLVNVFDFGLNSLANAKNRSVDKKNELFNAQISQQPETTYYNKRQLRGDSAMFAKNGGEYKEGGEYELSDAEVEKLKKMGYEIEIV